MRTRKGLTLMELLVIAVITAIMIIPTLDLMSTMFITHSDYNDDLQSKQTYILITERLSSSLREGAYVYPEATNITIPTQSSSTSINIGSQAIAILIPKFNTDGTIVQPYTNVTSFKGIAYSVIPENIWTSSTSDKFVLIETLIDNIDLGVDEDNPLKITETPTNSWTFGTSNKLGDKLMPAIFTEMPSLFQIANNNVKFGFFPHGNYLYFPSNTGITLNENLYTSSITLRNLR